MNFGIGFKKWNLFQIKNSFNEMYDINNNKNDLCITEKGIDYLEERKREWIKFKSYLMKRF